MSLVAETLADEIRPYFELDRALFGAAVWAFDPEGNPRRLNNFAYVMRQLGRIVLEHMPQKDKIK